MGVQKIRAASLIVVALLIKSINNLLLLIGTLQAAGV